MGTESHWRRRRELLQKKYGAGAPPSLISGPGSYGTVSDILECIIVGLTQEATQTLEKLLPALQVDIREERWRKGQSEHKGKECMASISEAAHVAHWMKNGTFSPSLGQTALHWRHELQLLWGAPITSPMLLHFMLICIESAQPEYALQLYEENQKRLLSLPPSGFRFTRNARDLLYLHLRLGKNPSQTALLKKAQDLFLSAAIRWEKKVQPIPYVGILEAARMVCALWTLEGRSTTVAEVARIVQ